MDDWFEWNGVKSTDLGLHVLSQPSKVMATERVEYQSIPGRSGSLTLLEGEEVYDDITLACTCLIDSPEFEIEGIIVNLVDYICGWLIGSGTIRFANQSDGFYIGRISNQISFDKVLRSNPHQSFQIQFRCSPYRYLDSGFTPISITGSPKALTNPGNRASSPLLKITGTAEGTIMCGDYSILVNNFTDVDYIMLDCDAKIVYKGALGDPLDPLVPLGTKITRATNEWFKIPVGDSILTFTSGINSVVVTPRWRCIG